jgi:hypothetical protein
MPESRVLIDLCCGLGGWSAGFIEKGWRVVGFDVERFPFPGQLVLQDVRTVDGRRLRGADLIVASPPCEQFSRHQMPWTKARNPPSPDLSLVEACYRIAREAGAPLILENVRSAQRWLGRAPASYGSRFLWGDGLPALVPYPGSERQKQSMSSSARPERSRIPLSLSRFMAEVYT